MVKEPNPSLEEWRSLYEAAIRFKEASPWEWMTDDQIFGIEDPETGQVGYVSVTGMLGEHFSLSLYLDAEGLYGLLTLAFDPRASAELLLEIPLLQASFEDRNTLRARDREVIKRLGLRFRGRNEWPMFRSYRPGYEPWYLTSAEARFLRWGLEQGLEVALRLKEDPDLLPDLDDERLLVRHPVRREDGTLAWEDQVQPMPEPASPFPGPAPASRPTCSSSPAQSGRGRGNGPTSHTSSCWWMPVPGTCSAPRSSPPSPRWRRPGARRSPAWPR